MRALSPIRDCYFGPNRGVLRPVPGAPGFLERSDDTDCTCPVCVDADRRLAKEEQK
jgi:hypothetical protein